MRQVVDLMKNLSLNLLSNVENQGRGRSFNQPNGVVVKEMVGGSGETCLLATTVVR